MIAISFIKTPQRIWALLALGSATLALTSLALPAWMGVEPCHLCIFQRLLFLVMALLGGLAAVARRGAPRLAGLLFSLVAATGMGVSGWQSWLQARPANLFSCVVGEPGPIQLLVDWLGERMPALFLATGTCADTALIILGLSLANWAMIAFLLALVGSISVLRRGWLP
jgi:protein dithiol:quinone oxidoreductase